MEYSAAKRIDDRPEQHIGHKGSGNSGHDQLCNETGCFDGHDADFDTQEYDCRFDEPFRFCCFVEKSGGIFEEIADDEPDQQRQQVRKTAAERQSPGQAIFVHFIDRGFEMSFIADDPDDPGHDEKNGPTDKKLFQVKFHRPCCQTGQGGKYQISHQ